MTQVQALSDSSLTDAERAKREGLGRRKPYVAAKLARINEMEERGQVSPIIRLEKSYLCNFQCTHCSAEYYMDRHLKNVLHTTDDRQKMDLNDIRELSRQADELGLARFVITGGEPLVMRDFDEVVAAIDPEKHYIITDTNGWFLDSAKARHIKSIGVEKVQLSLDSFNEADHDAFRNKPGSYKRVLRAIDASVEAGLNLILSTVLVKGRVKTEEFRNLCQFSQDRGIGLYVSYAKPTGSCTNHPEFVIEKEDADILREMEKEFSVFTHMTPSYGSFKGCITVKGIITVTSSMEVTPCPYIDLSIGNLRETPLKAVLDRGMRNPWLGPYRPDCIIGEDPDFIKLHMEKTHGATLLPLPYGQGFSDDDMLAPVPANAAGSKTDGGLFDQYGRRRPVGLDGAVPSESRRRFVCDQPTIDYGAIHRRLSVHLAAGCPLTAKDFASRCEAILEGVRNDPALSNMANAVHVPFFLPRASDADADIGAELEDLYLPAVGRAFAETFPNYSFTNHHKNGLKGKLTVAPGSRHERLREVQARDAMVGIYFLALPEYSPSAALQQMAGLPEHVLLAGAADTAAAMIACPDLLLKRDGYPPMLWMAGLTAEKPGAGYYFEAYGYNLTFNRRCHFGDAAEYWSSGLVVLG